MDSSDMTQWSAARSLLRRQRVPGQRDTRSWREIRTGRRTRNRGHRGPDMLGRSGDVPADASRQSLGDPQPRPPVVARPGLATAHSRMGFYTYR